MKREPDGYSSHPYEVFNLHMEGEASKAIYFYLQEGEPVDINIDQVLRATGVWLDLTDSQPKRTYHVVFEVRPAIGDPSLYISTVVVGRSKEAEK